MCGICNVVNCIRRSFCGCGSRSRNSGCGCSEYNESRYYEPRTNVTCANNRESCFTPCCDNDSTRCNNHRDCGSNYDYDCGCNH